MGSEEGEVMGTIASMQLGRSVDRLLRMLWVLMCVFEGLDEMQEWNLGNSLSIRLKTENPQGKPMLRRPVACY